MNFLREFREFLHNLLSWVFILIVFSFFFFFVGIEESKVFGRNIFLPTLSTHSLAVELFSQFQKDLLPVGVQLIVTNPLSAFLSQALVSIVMAFIFTIPFFLYKMITYLSPALFKEEKKTVYMVLFPSCLLFISGCLFAYFFLIPQTFDILYTFTVSLGAVPFFSIYEFVIIVLGLMIFVGSMFLLPVFMSLLSSMGIVKMNFWRNNWRYALIIFLTLSAVVTPDGTGITMILLSFPLIGLYFLGSFIAN